MMSNVQIELWRSVLLQLILFSCPLVKFSTSKQTQKIKGKSYWDQMNGPLTNEVLLVKSNIDHNTYTVASYPCLLTLLVTFLFPVVPVSLWTAPPPARQPSPLLRYLRPLFCRSGRARGNRRLSQVSEVPLWVALYPGTRAGKHTSKSVTHKKKSYKFITNKPCVETNSHRETKKLRTQNLHFCILKIPNGFGFCWALHLRENKSSLQNNHHGGGTVIL